MPSSMGSTINAGRMLADPYKSFVWNVKWSVQMGRRSGRDALRLLVGLDRRRGPLEDAERLVD